MEIQVRLPDRPEREEAEKLLRWVLYRSRKIGSKRIRSVRVGILEEVTLILNGTYEREIVDRGI